MDEKKPNPAKPTCSCVQDPFADLPPDVRIIPMQKLSGLRKVTCLGCGLVYWTNRTTDICIECEKKGVRVAESQETQ